MELSKYIREAEEENHCERARLVLNVIHGLDLTEEENQQWYEMTHR